MSWSHSKDFFNSLLWSHGRMQEKWCLAQIASVTILCSSTYHLCLSIASFAMCALTKVPVEAFSWCGFDWAHTALDVMGRRSIRMWFIVQHTATSYRSLCPNVQYCSVVESDTKLDPELRLWMLTISAAKLHIVRLDRNLGAIMYYLSFKVSISKIADAAFSVISSCRQAWLCQCVFQSFSALSSSPEIFLPPVSAEIFSHPKAKCVHIYETTVTLLLVDLRSFPHLTVVGC